MSAHLSMYEMAQKYTVKLVLVGSLQQSNKLLSYWHVI